MAPPAAPIVCSNCRATNPPGTRYCGNCGEAVDPALVADLQWLYGALRDMDARIAAGQGDRTIAALRDELRPRYQTDLAAPTKTPAQIAALHVMYRILLDLDARIAAGQGERPLSALREEYLARYTSERRAPAGQPAPASRPAPAAPYPAAPYPAVPYVPYPTGMLAPYVPPPPPAPPPGSPFTWRAFLADQAIGIMAYLGGFLLIIAALTFIVGAWQEIGDTIKLVIVIAVYVAFLALGVALRRAPHLRTVSRAYFGVFALMTPLVALAVYRFALQGLNLDVAGILCVSAAYAAVIYLALAWRTQFSTYGYLGWASALLATFAAIGWAALPAEWWIFALTAFSLVALAPNRVLRAPSLAAIARPGLYVSAVSSAVAALAALVLGLVLWVAHAIASSADLGHWLDVLFATACALVVLALGWSLTLRGRERPANAAIALADTSVAAAIAFAGLSAGLWYDLGRQELAYLVAGLAFAELVAAVVVRVVRPGRRGLRYGLAGVAFALAAFGPLSVLADASPNWPLIASLGAGVLVGVGMTAMERQPWWLLGGGLFLLAVYPSLVDLLRSAGAADALYALRPELVLNSFFYSVLALLLWGGALALTGRPADRRYAWPVYTVSLVAALLATLLLPIGASLGTVRIVPLADYQTIVLAVFALAALIAGARERQPLMASLPVAFFGFLLPLPYTIQAAAQGLPLSVIALASALIALGLRRLFGRTWAYAPYGVALWVTIFAALHASIPRVDTADWSALGVTFAAGLLFAVAALALVAAFWEGHPLATIPPAGLAFFAVLLTRDAIAQTVLVFVLIGVGMALREIKGRFWGVAWLAAAVPTSFVAVARIGDPAVAGPWYRVGVLLAFAIAAYAVAVQERLPWLTPIAALYAFVGLAAMPDPDNLLPSIAVTIGAVLGGIAIRVGVARGWTRALLGAASGRAAALPWTAAWYAVAAAGSVAIVSRSGVSPVYLPIALLALAALAYLVAAVERTAWLTPIAAAYGLWAALVIPGDGTDRLVATVALALGAALAGGALRLTAGRYWALAAYAVGVGASLVSLGRVVPYDVNTLQAVLLIYTVAASVIVAVEREPLSSLAPALYGSGAVVIQSDAHLLLPIALGFGLVGMVLGRRFGPRWSVAWYVVAAVAGLDTSLRGLADPGFEPLALLALALLAYAIAVVESLPEVLPLPFLLGALALASAAGYFRLERWETTLAFVGLSYLYAAMQWAWRAMPGLRTRVHAAPPPIIVPIVPGMPPAPYTLPMTAAAPRMVPTRDLGQGFHRWSAIALGALTLLTSLVAFDSFAPNALQTQIVAATMLGLAGLLALQAWLAGTRAPLYVGGELVAFAITWEARWLGADNVQAYVLGPASYHLLIGALLPYDKALRHPIALGRWSSAVGALLALVPAFFQTFTAGQELLYLGILTVEALVIVGIGVGTRARALILVGAGFVGVGAIRAAVLAVTEGVPIFLVIAGIAVLLMAGATWLSLRLRHSGPGSGQGPGQGPGGNVEVPVGARSAHP